MSIITGLQERRSGNQRISDFDVEPTLNMTAVESGNIRPGTMDRHTEFILTARIVTNFWANQAQYNDARRTAERVLAHQLFQPLPQMLDALRRAIFSGDTREALSICDHMSNEMGI